MTPLLAFHLLFAAAAAPAPASTKLEAALTALERGEDETAVRALTQLAAAGDAAALYHLGMLSIEGAAVARDPAAAIGYFSAAAGRGHAGAQYELARALLAEGETPERQAEGYRLAVALADAGSRPALCMRAEALVYGRGVAQDSDAGYALSQQAIELPMCRVAAGSFFFVGSETRKPDRAKAFQEWLVAARQGHAGAEASVGLALAEGIGVKTDQTEGLRWLRLAADQGEEAAVNYLAHHAASVEARSAVDAQLRRLRSERRRKKREFWNGVLEGVAVAMPAVTQAAQQYVDEQKRALADLTARNERLMREHAAAARAPEEPSARAATPSPGRVSRAPSPAPARAPSPGASSKEAPVSRVPPAPAREPAVETSVWLEAVVVCPRPRSDGKLMGASNCQGPRGSAFIDRVDGDINGKELDRACGSAAREIGWVSEYRVFGCGYGINPAHASSSGHYDQAERHGLEVSGRRRYRCPAKSAQRCSTPD